MYFYSIMLSSGSSMLEIILKTRVKPIFVAPKKRRREFHFFPTTVFVLIKVRYFQYFRLMILILTFYLKEK